MGNVHAQRGRLTAAIIVTVLAAVAVLVVLGLTAGPAAALGSFAHGGTSGCSSCHTATPAAAANASSDLCKACHTGFAAHAKGGVASTCWTCHDPGQSMTTIQTAAGCGSGAAGAACHNSAAHPGSTATTCLTCHGNSTGPKAAGQSAHHKASVTDVTVKPVLTVAVSTTRTTLGKTVKISGKARPITATYRVTITVQKRTATGAWAKVTTKAGSLPNATTYAWSVSYKPLKRGVYRFLAKTPKVASTTTVGVTAVSAGSKTSKLLTIK